MSDADMSDAAYTQTLAAELALRLLIARKQ
jgi:hypothetical protein